MNPSRFHILYSYIYDDVLRFYRLISTIKHTITLKPSLTVNNHSTSSNWLALAIGNSRLHWAWFKSDYLVEVWDSKHLSTEVKKEQLLQEVLPINLSAKSLPQLPIYLASVVPQQTKLWQDYLYLRKITLKDIVLKNIYPTMGIDRALATWGAGETYGYPCLVIDGGTALTFTGVDQKQRLVGGAIVPGLRAQFSSLRQKTAALPEITLPSSLPPRWALDTDNAIASGVIYTVIAGIHSYIIDWFQQFPDSQIVLTGGDSDLLSRYWQIQFPKVSPEIIIDPHLVFRGMELVHRRNKTFV